MTKDYLQPNFYRFNEDSIKLVKWILNTSHKFESVVDLGSGSGVIGIELARELKPKDLTLVEVQNAFEDFLIYNCQNFLPPEVAYRIEIKSFREFRSNKKHDLVVCNPPYYLPGQGEKAKDPKRAAARSFEIDSWAILIETFSTLLEIQGKGFLVLKSDERILELIKKEASANCLGIKMHQMDSIFILELFRLNEDRN